MDKEEFYKKLRLVLELDKNSVNDVGKEIKQLTFSPQFVKEIAEAQENLGVLKKSFEDVAKEIPKDLIDAAEVQKTVDVLQQPKAKEPLPQRPHSEPETPIEQLAGKDSAAVKAMEEAAAKMRELAEKLETLEMLRQMLSDAKFLEKNKGDELIQQIRPLIDELYKKIDENYMTAQQRGEKEEFYRREQKDEIIAIVDAAREQAAKVRDLTEYADNIREQIDELSDLNTDEAAKAREFYEQKLDEINEEIKKKGGKGFEKEKKTSAFGALKKFADTDTGGALLGNTLGGAISGATGFGGMVLSLLDKIGGKIVDKIKEIAKEATKELIDINKTSMDEISIQLEYGVNKQEAYAIKKTLEDMGLRSLNDYYLLTADQQKEFSDTYSDYKYDYLKFNNKQYKEGKKNFDSFWEGLGDPIKELTKEVEIGFYSSFTSKTNNSQGSLTPTAAKIDGLNASPASGYTKKTTTVNINNTFNGIGESERERLENSWKANNRQLISVLSEGE